MRIRATLALTFLLAACGGTVPSGSSQGHDLLYDASTERIAVVDSQSGRAERSLPLGVPAADWSHLYSVGGGGSLVDTEPSTGATLRTLPLPPGYELPTPGVSGVPTGLSANGRWLVLVLAVFDTSVSPPRSSHFLVVDTESGSTVRVDLDGRWEFDAISNDGVRLYLLEYLSGSSYRVRVYLVGERMLDPQVVVDKTDAQESMAGVRLTGVASPDGQFQYTVYARANEGAFIHALMLDGSGFSLCLFLPGSGYESNFDEMRWALVMNPAATRLYAVNAALGAAVEVAIGNGQMPAIIRTVHLQTAGPIAGILAQDVQAKELGAYALAISPDGGTLVAGAQDGVVWIDARSLSVRRQALSGWTVVALGSSPDGRRLYAVRDDGQIARLDAGSGAVTATFDPRAGQPMALLRVASP